MGQTEKCWRNVWWPAPPVGTLPDSSGWYVDGSTSFKRRPQRACVAQTCEGLDGRRCECVGLIFCYEYPNKYSVLSACYSDAQTKLEFRPVNRFFPTSKLLSLQVVPHCSNIPTSRWFEIDSKVLAWLLFSSTSLFDFPLTERSSHPSSPWKGIVSLMVPSAERLYVLQICFN